jgi:hypothetical protein
MALDGGEEERDPAADGSEHLDRIALLNGGGENRTSVTDDDEHLEQGYHLEYNPRPSCSTNLQ